MKEISTVFPPDCEDGNHYYLEDQAKKAVRIGPILIYEECCFHCTKKRRRVVWA